MAMVASTQSLRGPLMQMITTPPIKTTSPLPRSPASTTEQNGMASMPQSLAYSRTESMRPLYWAPNPAMKNAVMIFASSTGWKVRPMPGSLIQPVKPLALYERPGM